MTTDGSSIGSVALGLPAAGNGAMPLSESAPGLSVDMARLREECEALRVLAVGHGAEMESLSRRKDELIAIASHDLRTPLSIIFISAQRAGRLLATPSPDLEKVGYALEMIQEQSRAMTRLTEDLLDASLLQMGLFDVCPTACDMGSSLMTVVARLGPDEEGRIEVSVPHAYLTGRWDERRVEQVLANLIANALKYSPAGSKVKVVVTRNDAGIEVAVSDRGMGLLPDEVKQIFQQFHRSPRASASGRAGCGLGLYICNGIVTAHGGRLWAESPGVNLGSTFRFTLPNNPPLGQLQS